MALGYGAILADDGRLQVGPTALTSGVRLPPDEYADFAVTAEGLVEPRTGGISVAPAWRRLPVHRLLRRLRGQFPRAVGKNALFRWRLGDAVFAEGPLGRGRLEPTRSCDSAPDTHAVGLRVWQHPDRPWQRYPFSGHDRRTTILRARAGGAC